MQALGFNYRLPDLLCALGLSQLAKLDRFAAKRRALAARYREDSCKPRPGSHSSRPAASVPAWSDPAPHLFVALIDFEAAGVFPGGGDARPWPRAGSGNRCTTSRFIASPTTATATVRPRPARRRRLVRARRLSLPLFPGMSGRRSGAGGGGVAGQACSGCLNSSLIACGECQECRAQITWSTRQIYHDTIALLHEGHEDRDIASASWCLCDRAASFEFEGVTGRAFGPRMRSAIRRIWASISSVKPRATAPPASDR